MVQGSRYSYKVATCRGMFILYFEEVQSIGGVLLSYAIFHMISLWLVDEATGRYVLEYFLTPPSYVS